MSKDFDAELDSIVGAHRAADDAAKQRQADSQAAAAAFAKAWEACRNGLVKPLLNEIVQKLASRGVGAQFGELAGGALSLTVPIPGMPLNVRGHEHPQLSIIPSSGPMNVTFKYAIPGAKQTAYPVEQITREVIEQHALQLVRSVYGQP
ncbi:MAG: hypothetical protein WCB10_00855 [Steroidobacteraceae bacterium]